MPGRNGRVMIGTYVPVQLASAFKARARATDGGVSAALRRLIAEAATTGLHGASGELRKFIMPSGVGCGEQIGIRLKPTERRALAEAAEAQGTSPANWIRSLALVHLAGKPQWNGAELEALRELFKELRRIGNNVNQITRALNVAIETQEYTSHQGDAAREAAELIRFEMRRVVAVITGNFDYWGLPDAERPIAALGAIERADAEAAAAEVARRRRPRKRAARFSKIFLE